MTLSANIIDIPKQNIYHGKIEIQDGKIVNISPCEGESEHYICPGFIDAHIHIESSMLVPSEFARLAVLHGTVATVSDPHEIANVMGMEGVRYMIKNGKSVPLKFHFGAPSCVPATSFETAGAEINVRDIEELMSDPDILYLAEMMNYPGVLFDDPEVLAKIKAAQKYNKPVDGHAPGLRGADAQKYIDAGISTDHECFTEAEGLDKLERGMKILIREGSAAKNFEALIGLLPKWYEKMMFCSDDKHPDDLLEGHINTLVRRAIAKDCGLFETLQVACLNPITHYNLPVGQLRKGDAADFIILKDLSSFEVVSTYIDGVKVSENGKVLFPSVQVETINNFSTSLKEPEDFIISTDKTELQVIKAINGEIVTDSFWTTTVKKNEQVLSDVENDILKLVVVNRYEDADAAVAFINGFELKEGAIASCVGHDSHNIIAVGVDDESICKAVNLIIENKGGISAVDPFGSQVLPLPVAGIMTHANGKDIAAQYLKIDRQVKENQGSNLSAPYMTLSFMALLVIPQLKLSDKGLFDGKSFEFSPLFR